MHHAKEDLPQALDHVLYEMEMMQATAELLPHLSEHATLKNAVLESFIVHTRCLEEFFCKAAAGAKPDTMQPHHFFPDFPKKQINADNRMHKEVAHLTYSRKNWGEIRGWNVFDIAKEVAGWSLPFLEKAQQNEQLMAFGKNRERTNNLIPKLKAHLLKVVVQSSGTSALLDSTTVSSNVKTLAVTTDQIEKAGTCET